VSGPLGGFNFSIRLIETAKPASAVVGTFAPPAVGGFSECSGLEASMQVDEWREGGRNDAVLRFPGHVTHPNLKLRRGMATGTDLWAWHQGFLQGRGKRRDGVIELLGSDGTPVETWRFRRGLLVRWAASAFSAIQNSLAIEEVEIAHEGLFVQAGGVLGDVAATLGSVAQSLRSP
jgi:phage tail-like protein